MVDEQLIKACIKGDRKAQFELFDKCYAVLMSICCRYRKNREDAKASLNQGFLNILKGLPKYKRESPFEAWIRKIMIHVLIDEYRKRKHTPEIIELGEVILSPVAVDYKSAEELLDADTLERMIRQLPERSRQVFNLYAIDGYRHREIARMLDISVGTSKWHLSRARELLKEKIAAYQTASKASGT